MSLLMELKEYAVDFKTEAEHPYSKSYYSNLYCCRQLLKIGLSDSSIDSISFPIEAGFQDYHKLTIYFLFPLEIIFTYFQISYYTNQCDLNHYYKNSQTRSHHNYFRRPLFT